MARDYAQRGGGRRQTKGRGGGGGTPGWIWLAVGLAIGLAIAAFVYIQRPADPALAQQGSAAQAVTPAQEEAPRKRTPPKKERDTLPLPPKEKERFTFYELLPNQEVVVPRGDAKTEAGKPAADAASYIIQVASFRDREEADRQKAALALLGVESRIERVTIDDAETFYRVRVGPLKDFGKVQIISNRLQDNGIPALVVKVK